MTMLSVEKVSFDAIHGGAAEIFKPAVELTVLTWYENVLLDRGPDLIVGALHVFLAERQRRSQ